MSEPLKLLEITLTEVRNYIEVLRQKPGTWTPQEIEKLVAKLESGLVDRFKHVRTELLKAEATAAKEGESE